MAGRRLARRAGQALAAAAALAVALCLGACATPDRGGTRALSAAAPPCAAHALETSEGEVAADHGDLHAAHCCSCVVSNDDARGSAAAPRRAARPAEAARLHSLARAPPAPPPRAI